jgi:hypothetical protein
MFKHTAVVVVLALPWLPGLSSDRCAFSRPNLSASSVTASFVSMILPVYPKQRSSMKAPSGTCENMSASFGPSLARVLLDDCML